jgi:DNA-binding NtrC family response regulator
VDVRVVCATHRDLKRLQHEGKFREDLYARLNEYELRLPALRDRKEDTFALVRVFLERHGGRALAPSFLYMAALLHYDWPYNVRELEACIKRGIALSDGRMLDETHLPEAVREAMADYGRKAPAQSGAISIMGGSETLPRGAMPTDQELRALLELHGGNVAAVGRELGRARMQVHRWLARYGIKVDDYRG